MRRAVVIEVLRSAFGRGRAGGALYGLHPVDLFARVIQALVAKSGIDPTLIDDVIAGCVIQVAEQSGNIGRQAVLAAGLPESIPAVTLDRKCGSAQQAVDFAAQAVIAGACDAVIAGGVEMMSTVHMRANRLGKDNRGAQLAARYPAGFIDQGSSAELIATKWSLSRHDLDELSLASHQRAAHAEDRGLFAETIVPIMVGEDQLRREVRRDEGIRRDTSLQQLGSLAPAFRSEGMARRFPTIAWNITAGNSSQVSDGASAALIVEESFARRHGLTPRAAITHFAVAAADPILMLTAPIPATQKLLRKAGLAIDDIGAFEVNEAFASVVLAWQRELGVDPARINRYGGAIALGHPVGASGGRLLANLLAAMQREQLRYGLQTMCESGGMANATLFELV